MKLKTKIIISIIAGVILIGALIGVGIWIHNSRAKSDGAFNLELVDASGQVIVEKEIEFNVGDKLSDLLNDSELNFVFSESEYGLYIESIYNLTLGATEYWRIVVNGVDASVGISTLPFQDGDLIQFIITDWS